MDAPSNAVELKSKDWLELDLGYRDRHKETYAIPL
jgi:hypothetical protein